MEEKNPAALSEMKDRLLEAIERRLWTPRSNSAQFDLTDINETKKKAGSQS
jgi:cobaltochelatase CobN